MSTFNTRYNSELTDAEIDLKLQWLESRLPMSRLQIIKRAVERYYNHHLQRANPSASVIKSNLLSAQGNECYYCKRYLLHKSATIDHKQPLARGGTADYSNLCAACQKCNNLKDTMTEQEFQEFLVSGRVKLLMVEPCK